MIGVFDSGVGGLSVLRALRAQLPAEDFTYIADAAHAPYGERDEAFVIGRSLELARCLIDEHGARLVVVACNTATAAAIDRLRETHPQVPMVGIEPALKPAALASRTRRVGVMATRATLASSRFEALRRKVVAPTDVELVLQACDGLALAIERGDASHVRALCERHVAALGPLGDGTGEIDTIVLGCTHYAFAEDAIRRVAGPAVALLEPGVPVARRVSALLEGQRPLARKPAGQVRYLSTSASSQALATFARQQGI